jgi:hypothetical protein
MAITIPLDLKVKFPRFWHHEEEGEEIVTHESWWHKCLHFVSDTATGIKDKIVDFIKGMVNHTAGVITLAFAGIGVVYVIGELAFKYALPAFVESSMFAPVCAVIVVWLLCKAMGWQLAHPFWK